MKKLENSTTQHITGGVCVTVGQSQSCLNCAARIAVVSSLAGGLGPGGAAALICIA